MDFIDQLKHRGNAAEDDYFARKDRELADAIQRKREAGELEDRHQDEDPLSE